MAVGAGLDAIEHHARQALDPMHLAGREDDAGARTQAHLLAAIVEEAFTFHHVVDLVGVRVRMDGRCLTRLPAHDADRAMRGLGEKRVDVAIGRKLERTLEIQDVHPRLLGERDSSKTPSLTAVPHQSLITPPKGGSYGGTP